MDKQCLELFFEEMFEGQKADTKTLNQIASDNVIQRMFDDE